MRVCVCLTGCCLGLQVISRGMTHRRVGSHELNLESSRSHSIMTVYVESSPTNQQVMATARVHFLGCQLSSCVTYLRSLPRPVLMADTLQRASGCLEVEESDALLC